MRKFLQNFKTFCFVLALLSGASVYSQTTYDFASGLTIYSSGGMTNNMAKFTVGGVEYTINGGINGSLTNPTTGGTSNGKCLKKGTAGGDTFTLSRTDGQPFQFYGLWVKHNSMNSYTAFISLPPFFTMTASDDCDVRASYTDNTPIQGGSYTTSSYNWAISGGKTVKTVQISFKATLDWWIDDIVVGPALNNNPANITTATASNVTSNSALLGGSIVSVDNTMDYGIIWSTVNSTPAYDSDVNNHVVSASSGSGNFSSTVNFTGVAAGSTVYYRAFSDNWNCGTEYGETKSLILSGTLNAIDLQTQKPLSIAPNPASTFFSINGLTKKSSVQLIDANGKVVLEKTATADENIKIEHLPKGLYFVKINNSVLKLIKK